VVGACGALGIFHTTAMAQTPPVPASKLPGIKNCDHVGAPTCYFTLPDGVRCMTAWQIGGGPSNSISVSCVVVPISVPSAVTGVNAQ
jgi:hypothetical protein